MLTLNFTLISEINFTPCPDQPGPLRGWENGPCSSPERGRCGVTYSLLMLELVWQILSDWEASPRPLVSCVHLVRVTAPPLVRSQMSLSDCAMKIKMVKCMSQIGLTRSSVRLRSCRTVWVRESRLHSWAHFKYQIYFSVSQVVAPDPRSDNEGREERSGS